MGKKIRKGSEEKKQDTRGVEARNEDEMELKEQRDGVGNEETMSQAKRRR